MTATTIDIVHGWQRDFHMHTKGTGLTKGVNFAQELALEEAHQIRTCGHTYIDYEPGNGTRYGIAITDTRRHTFDQVRASYVADIPLSVLWHRVMREAKATGPEARWGGRWLIAMPSLRSSIMWGGGLMTPDYLAEAAKIGFADAVPLAILLTLISEAIDQQEDAD